METINESLTTGDHKLLKNKIKTLSKQLENKESEFIQITMYVTYKMPISFHPISSYLGCDMVPKDELTVQKKIPF